MKTSTAAVTDGKMTPVGTDTPVALVTGTLLTAQGLLDRLDSVDSSEEVKSRLAGLLDDFSKIPLTAGLDLIRDAKKTALAGADGETVTVKERTPQQVTRAKRLSEAKSIFVALCLVFKANVKKYNGLGWHGAYALSSNALQQAGLTTSGGVKVEPEEKAQAATIKANSLAYAQACQNLGVNAQPEAIIAEAARVRDAMQVKAAEEGAGEALIALGSLMSKAQQHIAVLRQATNFRQYLPEAARNDGYWEKLSAQALTLTRWGQDWEADKANGGEEIRAEAVAKAA